MRITFLNGSLEPGKDGVGDYTRLLALECARLGATCQAIALADRHATHPSTTRPSADVELIRLPAHLPFQRRLEAVERASRWFAPQWVSVQFVPFSYQRWGIATTFVRALPRLVDPARLHVMFHEIWIGPDGSWRRRLVSEAQRRCVLRVCRYPRAIIHTSNGLYQEILDAHGVNAGVLPLFGSVPIAAGDAMPWLGAQLSAIRCDAATARAKWWLFAFFGTLHPVWPPEPLIGRLIEAGGEAGRRIALISLGRLGAGEGLWREMEARYLSRVPMLRLGEQPDERISEVFNSVDFGIATSPLALLGKSASVTAMLEHGLPVVVNRDDIPAAQPSASGSPNTWSYTLTDARERRIRPDDHIRTRQGRDDDSGSGLVIRMDDQFPRLLLGARRAAPHARRSAVAARFLAELEAASNRPAPLALRVGLSSIA